MAEGFMNSFEEASEGGAVKSVAIVASTSALTSTVLGAISGYRNAVDPSTGMPRWKVGLDAAVMGVGLLGALVLDDGAALASLGAGLAGLNSMATHYSTLGGAYLAMALGHAGQPKAENPTNESKEPAVKGHGDGGEQIHEGGVGSMKPRQRARYAAYLGK